MVPLKPNGIGGRLAIGWGAMLFELALGRQVFDLA